MSAVIEKYFRNARQSPDSADAVHIAILIIDIPVYLERFQDISSLRIGRRGRPGQRFKSGFGKNFRNMDDGSPCIERRRYFIP